MKSLLIFFIWLIFYPCTNVLGQYSALDMKEGPRLIKSNEPVYKSTNWLNSFQYYDAEDHWTEIGPFTSSENVTKDVGRLSYLTIDPENDSIVLVGSPNGGLYFTLDKGETWINGGLDRPKEMHDLNMFTPGISSIIVIHDQGKTYWIVSTGDKDQNFSFSRGVIRSSDFGENWQLINGSGELALPDNWYYIRRIAGDPDDRNVMFALTSRGLYKSENILAPDPASVTWNKILDDPPGTNEGFFDMEFHIKNPDTLFLSREYRAFHEITGDELLWSTDGGANWVALPGSDSILPVGKNFTYFLTNFEVTPADNSVLYLYIKGKIPADSNSYYHHHLKYNVDLKKWTELNSIPYKEGNGRNGYAVSPVDNNLIYCSTVPTYVSLDGGYNWIKDNDTLLENGAPKNSPHSDIQDLKFNKTGKEIWAASDGGPYMKKIGDSAWQNKINNVGLAKILKFDQSAYDPGYYLFGGWDVGSQLYNKHKGEWTQAGGGDGFGCAFDDRENGIFYTAGYSGDHNIFSKFTNFTDSVNYLFGKFWSANIAVSQVDHKQVYISLGNNITVSDDQGNSWYTLVDLNDLGLDPDNYLLYDVYVPDQNGHYLYLLVVNINQGTHPQVFKSTNVHEQHGLINWENITPDPPLKYWLSDLEIDELNPERIWITYNTLNPEKVLEYDGHSWSNISWNLNDLNCGVNSIAHLKGTSKGLFAGTLYGIYYLPDDSSHWILYKPGLPNNINVGIKINYKSRTLLTGLDGRGMWETAIPDNYMDPDVLKYQMGSLKIYPNPVSEKFEVWSPLFENNICTNGNSYLRIYNGFAQLIAESSLNGFRRNYTFSCNDWRNGVYFAAIFIDGNLQETVKFIIR